MRAASDTPCVAPIARSHTAAHTPRPAPVRVSPPCDPLGAPLVQAMEVCRTPDVGIAARRKARTIAGRRVVQGHEQVVSYEGVPVPLHPTANRRRETGRRTTAPTGRVPRGQRHPTLDRSSTYRNYRAAPCPTIDGGTIAEYTADRAVTIAATSGAASHSSGCAQAQREHLPGPTRATSGLDTARRAPVSWRAARQIAAGGRIPCGGMMLDWAAVAAGDDAAMMARVVPQGRGGDGMMGGMLPLLLPGPLPLGGLVGRVAWALRRGGGAIGWRGRRTTRRRRFSDGATPRAASAGNEIAGWWGTRAPGTSPHGAAIRCAAPLHHGGHCRAHTPRPGR